MGREESNQTKSYDIRYMLRTRLVLKLGLGHSDPKMVRDTLSSQDASTHQIWNLYLKEYRRYAPDSMQILETKSGQGRGDSRMLHDQPKMHSHTKFGIRT